MKSFKHIQTFTTEIYFLLSTMFYWMFNGSTVNPFAIVFLTLLILQLVFRNKVSGVVIAATFIIFNIYIFFALLSEFHEFSTINIDAIKFLVFGLLFFGLNLFVALLMLIKYIKKASSFFQITSYETYVVVPELGYIRKHICINNYYL